MNNPTISWHGWWRVLIFGLLVLAGVLPLLFYLLAGGTSHYGPTVQSVQSIPLMDQTALVGAVYGFKTLYMLLALAAIVLLWGEAVPALAALRWSMIFFLVGEVFCWINILFFFEESLLLEYLHSFFMVACLGFLAFSVMEALDHGLLHFSNPQKRCALSGVCKSCVKAKPGPCLLHRLFRWMIPIIGLVGLMPLAAQPLAISYNTSIFGIVRNLTHPLPVQWYEIRFCPAAALILLTGAWLALSWRGGTPGGTLLAKVLLAAAIGHLGFTFMRLAFLTFYRERIVWFFFWEELTELILITSVLYLLWLFQPQLGQQVRARLRALMS